MQNTAGRGFSSPCFFFFWRIPFCRADWIIHVGARIARAKQNTSKSTERDWTRSLRDCKSNRVWENRKSKPQTQKSQIENHKIPKTRAKITRKTRTKRWKIARGHYILWWKIKGKLFFKKNENFGFFYELFAKKLLHFHKHYAKIHKHAWKRACHAHFYATWYAMMR